MQRCKIQKIGDRWRLYTPHWTGAYPTWADAVSAFCGYIYYDYLLHTHFGVSRRSDATI